MLPCSHLSSMSHPGVLWWSCPECDQYHRPGLRTAVQTVSTQPTQSHSHHGKVRFTSFPLNHRPIVCLGFLMLQNMEMTVVPPSFYLQSSFSSEQISQGWNRIRTACVSYSHPVLIAGRYLKLNLFKGLSETTRLLSVTSVMDHFFQFVLLNHCCYMRFLVFNISCAWSTSLHRQDPTVTEMELMLLMWTALHRKQLCVLLARC